MSVKLRRATSITKYKTVSVKLRRARASQRAFSEARGRGARENLLLRAESVKASDRWGTSSSVLSLGCGAIAQAVCGAIVKLWGMRCDRKSCVHTKYFGVRGGTPHAHRSAKVKVDRLAAPGAYSPECEGTQCSTEEVVRLPRASGERVWDRRATIIDKRASTGAGTALSPRVMDHRSTGELAPVLHFHLGSGGDPFE